MCNLTAEKLKAMMERIGPDPFDSLPEQLGFDADHDFLIMAKDLWESMHDSSVPFMPPPHPPRWLKILPYISQEAYILRGVVE